MSGAIQGAFLPRLLLRPVNLHCVSYNSRESPQLSKQNKFIVLGVFSRLCFREKRPFGHPPTIIKGRPNKPNLHADIHYS